MNAWKASASLHPRHCRWQTLSVVAIILFWVGSVPAAGQVAPQNFSSACARCHPKEAASEPTTPMGRALELPGANPTLASHPKLTVRKGPYTYTVQTEENKSVYSVTDGIHTIAIPIRWSFGEGAQTWLLEHNGEYYESLVSYYPSIDGLDITTGDGSLKPDTLESAIGRKLSNNDVTACFDCHATKAVSNGQLSLATLEPGVRCEHCHTGLENHLVSQIQSGGDIVSAPPSLGRLNPEEISRFCGQCHRTWELVARRGWRGVINARFQPYRLANSKCFDGTDHRIGCLACHDPHQTVVRDDTFYDPKCLACHAASGSSSLPPRPARAKVCPVAKSNCVTCHMPKVRLPNGLMTFYDHQIRVAKPNEPYPN